MSKRCCIILLFCCILLGSTSFAARTGNLKKHDHIYSVFVSVEEPTCEEDGYKEYKCQKCDDVQHIVLPKKGHHWVTVSETPPICIYQGKREKICDNDNCEARKTETFGEAPRKEHDLQNIDVKPANCIYPMQIIKRCNYCGEVISEWQGEALGHDFKLNMVDWNGNKVFKCDRCDDWYREEAHRCTTIISIERFEDEDGARVRHMF